MSLKIILTLFCMISFTVVANLILKQGAMVPASERVLFGVMGWKSFVGLVAFGCAGLIYAVVLRWLPLNVAQSIASIQFVAVILASAVILSEPIPPMRWLGIVLIALGVLLVGTTVDGSAGHARDTHPSVKFDR